MKRDDSVTYTNASVFFYLPLHRRTLHDDKQQSQLNNHKDYKTKTLHLNLFLARDLLGSLGNLASLLGLLNTLDDTNSNGLSHIPNSEPSKRRIIGESLNAHWLGGNHLDNSSITRLDKLGRIFDLLATSSINLLEEFSEFTSDVGGVTIENGGVSSTNLTRVIQDDDLSVERFSSLRGIVLGISANVPSSDFFDRDVLDVESDIVSGETFDEGFVVHFNRLDFSGDVGGSKSDDHAGFDDTSFDTTDRDSSDTADLVDVLEGQTERLVGWTDWGFNTVDGFKEGESLGCTSLGLLGPTLEPSHVGRLLNHVVSVPSRDGDESNSLGVVT